jgi:hypothetical protein
VTYYRGSLNEECDAWQMVAAITWHCVLIVLNLELLHTYIDT